jgi:hypothetical protein
MKKTRLEKELIQAGKELRLLEEGKLKLQPLDEVISEMRAKHGGKREGAGRKTDAKKTRYIRVTPEEKDFIQKMRKRKELFTKQNKPFVIKLPASGKAARAESIVL